MRENSYLIKPKYVDKSRDIQLETYDVITDITSENYYLQAL
jgi:hypothetical protein